MSKKKKKTEKIGKINPNLIKSRDIIHMLEFLNGSGGPHLNKRRSNKHNRREGKRQGQEDGPG